MFSFWYNLQICNDLCCIKPEENELFTVIADLSDALTILKHLLLEPWESQYLINKPLLPPGSNWGFLLHIPAENHLTSFRQMS